LQSETLGSFFAMQLKLFRLEPDIVNKQQLSHEREIMQRFGYRNPRYSVDFPVRLTLGDSVQITQCSNVSLDGISLQISSFLRPNVSGQVSFEYENLFFDLCVRVTHCGSRLCGLKFLYRAESQRDAILELIARLAERHSRPQNLTLSAPGQLVISRRPVLL